MVGPAPRPAPVRRAPVVARHRPVVLARLDQRLLLHPARTVVVGTLCALGIALIAYEGHSPEENVLLDFSGFMALLVAAVPTVPDTRCGPSPFDETTDEIAAGIGVSVPTLVVAALVALGGDRCHPAAVDARRQHRPSRDPHRRPVGRVHVPSCVVELVLVTVLRGQLVAAAHGVAATTMVTGAIAVMVCSALRVDERHGAEPSELATAAAYRRTYLTLARVLGRPAGAHGRPPPDRQRIRPHGARRRGRHPRALRRLLGVQTVELWDLGDDEHPEARSVRGVRA